MDGMNEKMVWLAGSVAVMVGILYGVNWLIQIVAGQLAAIVAVLP